MSIYSIIENYNIKIVCPNEKLFKKYYKFIAKEYLWENLPNNLINDIIFREEQAQASEKYVEGQIPHTCIILHGVDPLKITESQRLKCEQLKILIIELPENAQCLFNQYYL